MYEFRDKVAEQDNFELKVFTNPRGVEEDINPLDHGSEVHTDIMKTQALKMALDENAFDVAFGGARRDEEKSRQKKMLGQKSMLGIQKIKDLSYGITLIPERARKKQSGFSHYQTGQNLIYGNTSMKKR